MAAVTLLGTATFNTTAGTHTVTATPAVGDLIVIVVANTTSTTSVAPTDNNSGGAGTYDLINSAVKLTSADTMRIYIRTATVVTAASTVFTQAPGGASSGGGLAVLKVTGMTKVGAAAAVQSAIQSNQAAAGTPAPVLSAIPDTNNPVIGAVFNATNPATMTPRTGYTERADVGYATPTTGLEVMSRDTGETSATITWGGTSASAFASLAIELDASPTLTQAAFRTYEDGTESGSTAIAAQDTNITRDVTADSNLALRVRLQNQGAAPGVSTDDYQLQYEKNDSGRWLGLSSEIITSYPSSNQNTSTNISTGNLLAFGETFSGNGNTIGKAQFYIRKVGTITGNAVTKLYAHTGTFGSTGKPTGTALATSNNLDVSTLTGSLQLTDFTFDGAEQYTTANGTNYCIALEYSGGDASNYVELGLDNTSPTYAGNGFYFIGGSWSSDTSECIFYLYSPLGTEVVPYASANLTDGGATTNRLSTPAENYSETNQSGLAFLSSVENWGSGQSFTGTGKNIASAQFYLQKSGLPTGNATAKIYAHSGTYGTNSIPTGTALATSDNFDVSTLTTSLVLKTLTFSGANQIALTDGTNYVLTFEYNGGNGSNDVVVGTDSTSPTHSGNRSVQSSAGVWTGSNSTDMCFYLNYSSSFVAGEVSETGLVTDHTITASNYTEHLYSLTVVSSAVANNDTLDFRVLRNGAVLNTYTVTPRITVTKTGGGGGNTTNFFQFFN